MGNYYVSGEPSLNHSASRSLNIKPSGLASLNPGIKSSQTGPGSRLDQPNRASSSSLPQAPPLPRARSLPRDPSRDYEDMLPHQLAVELNDRLISDGKHGLSSLTKWAKIFRENNVTTFAEAKTFYNNKIESNNVKRGLHRNQQKKAERINTVQNMVLNMTGIPLAFASAGIGLKLLRWGFNSILHSISSQPRNISNSGNWVFHRLSGFGVRSKQIDPSKMMTQVFKVVFYNIPLVGGVFQFLLRSNGLVDGFYFPKSNMDTKDRT